MTFFAKPTVCSATACADLNTFIEFQISLRKKKINRRAPTNLFESTKFSTVHSPNTFDDFKCWVVVDVFNEQKSISLVRFIEVLNVLKMSVCSINWFLFESLYFIFGKPYAYMESNEFTFFDYRAMQHLWPKFMTNGTIFTTKMLAWQFQWNQYYVLLETRKKNNKHHIQQ